MQGPGWVKRTLVRNREVSLIYDAAHMAGKEQAATPEAGFDDTLIALRQVVDRLESGSLSLETSLESFEEGIRLARRGTMILDAAEHRVEILTSSPHAAEQSAAKIEDFTRTTP